MGRHIRPHGPRHALPRPPHRAALGAVALLGVATTVGGAAGIGLSLHGSGGSGDGRSAAATAPDPGLVAAQPRQPAAAARQQAVRPRSVSIPAIGVHSDLAALGLTPAGALDVPKDPAEAGWFTGASVPGAVGPAVLAGHVDSLDGPAVFARLSLLRQRDIVTVALSDGTSVRFQVTAVQRYAKEQFPTAAVYDPQPDPQLRLITCGGTFDGHNYLDNVVVFARLAPPTTAGA